MTDEPLNTGPDALTHFVNRLCVAAFSSPAISQNGAQARALLRNVSIEEGFGDGRITKHLATGTWRTERSRAHRAAHARECPHAHVTLDLERCAPIVRATFVRGLAPPRTPATARTVGGGARHEDQDQSVSMIVVDAIRGSSSTVVWLVGGLLAYRCLAWAMRRLLLSPG